MHMGLVVMREQSGLQNLRLMRIFGLIDATGATQVVF